MKKVYLSVVCIGLVLCVAACQPTPEAPIVIGKNDGKLEEKIAEENDAFFEISDADIYLNESDNALARAIGAPEKWEKEEETDKIPFGTLSLTVNATVHIPDANAQVSTVKLQALSLSEKQAVIDVFFADKTAYVEDLRMTKADYMQSVEAAQQNLRIVEREIEQGEDFADLDEMLREAREELAKTQAAMAQAPDEKEHTEYTGEDAVKLALCTLDEQGAVAERLEIYSCETDTEMYLRGNFVSYMSSEYDAKTMSSEMLNVQMPQTEEQEQAVRLALDAAQRLRAAGMGTEVRCAGVCAVKNSAGKELATIVRLYPTYGGLPSYPFLWATGSPYAAMDSGMDASMYTTQLPQEEIYATVADGKLVYFQWRNALEVLKVENENAEIFDFAEMETLFCDNIKRNLFAEEDDTLSVIVTDVYLGTTLVQKPDSEEYYLLPVWDFLAAGRATSGENWFDAQSKSILTLNAIDGSIVHRTAGFEV